MKKVVGILLSITLLSLVVLPQIARASELDDQNVSVLLDNATKVRSYGDYCWEMEFTGNWKIPFEYDEFRLYVMDLDVVKTPKGNYSYPQFSKQFTRSLKKEFKQGDRAFVICLPAAISFNQFKESIFKPWGQQEKAGTSKNWLFPRLGKVFYAKQEHGYGHTWLTGVRAIQDFICLGKDDPRIIKIDGDSITFKPYGYLCFEPTHKENWPDNPFADKWEDETGQNLVDKRLEADKTYTLTYKRATTLPKGWD